MITNNPAVLAQIIGFGIFLWVGLYVLVRGARRTPLIVVSLIGLFAQAIFFATGALTDTRADLGWFIALQRWSLWTIVVPAAAWFHVSSLIARSARAADPTAAPALFPPLVVASYTAGALLIAIGTTTDLIIDYSHPLGQPGAFVIGPGPGYLFIMAFLALTASAAFANLLRARRALAHGHGTGDRALARQLSVLAGGALFFLAGALWLTARKNWSLPISMLPGFLFLFVGLAALGYGVAHFGLLLDGQNVQRDFLYNLTGITLLNMLYGGLLALAGPASVVSALALVALVTITHTTFDLGRNVLDRLFFSPPERDARAEARDYASALGTTPVTAPTPVLEPEPVPAESAPPVEKAQPAPAIEQDYKAFPAQVRKALTSLKSPPQLAKSPLLSLALVERRVARAGQEDNRLNRAAALRELLIEQIEGLWPDSDGSAHRVGEAWRFYNVLYYPYVRELSRKSALAEARRLSEERRRNGQREPGELEQVLAWLADVDEDTFYKWQRRASDTIATILWEENLKIGQEQSVVENVR
ncbi:MAG TPA: hypothetical protein VFU22_08835 [Roseiflexaceae bacterium]|nr:hypothetical protein [Roseiflexaceae bacterium]